VPSILNRKASSFAALLTSVLEIHVSHTFSRTVKLENKSTWGAGTAVYRDSRLPYHTQYVQCAAPRPRLRASTRQVSGMPISLIDDVHAPRLPPRTCTRLTQGLPRLKLHRAATCVPLFCVVCANYTPIARRLDLSLLDMTAPLRLRWELNAA